MRLDKDGLEIFPRIYARISDVMTDIEAIGKNRKNDQQGWKFRGIDEIYNELHPLLAKHKVFTATNVLDSHREERPTKSGGVMTYTVMKINFKYFTDDGSFVDSVVIGEGSDSGDKSSNKAMAIGHKYSLMQTFAIPTEDDKDPDQQAPEFAPQQTRAPQVLPPAKGPTQPMLKRLFAIAQSSGYPSDEVKKIIEQRYGIKSSHDLDRKSYDDLCSLLEKNPFIQPDPEDKSSEIPF